MFNPQPPNYNTIWAAYHELCIFWFTNQVLAVLNYIVSGTYNNNNEKEGGGGRKKKEKGRRRKERKKKKKEEEKEEEET